MTPIFTAKTDVETWLKKISLNKSTGLDGVTPWLLNEECTVLSHSLTLLFQKSLSSKYIPQDWKDVYITSVNKGGIIDDSNNYWLISLASGIGKLLEGMVNSTIMALLNSNSLLSDNQHGFCPNRLVDTNLIIWACHKTYG